MGCSLISHPSDGDTDQKYPANQLTAEGHLRLKAHNATVADRAVRLFGPSDNRRQFLRVAAALHDFGKATPQFQDYVRPDKAYEGPEEEKAHARLGAVATWYVLRSLGAPPKDRLAATLAIARHHQALPNAAQYTAETFARALEESENTILSQVSSIDDNWPAAATELLHLSGTNTVSWEDLADWIETGDAPGELRKYSARETLSGSTPSPGKLPDRLYDRMLHYWSAITLADKSHAMAIPEEQVFDLSSLDRKTIEEYISDIRANPPENELKSNLNDERERARRQTIRGVHDWVAGKTSIATLTLPTGLGKTFTGLSAAFEARDILSKREGSEKNPRPIVYALPYTSIIEQTRALFEDSELWGADPKKSALTVHHYLSETVVYNDEYDDTDVGDTDAEEFARLLGESWRDGTILTTFVQLFESLTGPSNRQGMKLPALDSGLVILDEPQTLPKDWWDGIDRLLDLLTNEYGARVIAMTATQPTLLRDKETNSLLQLGEDHGTDGCTYCQDGPSYRSSLPPSSEEEYFEEAERVRYTIDETALSHQLHEDNQFLGHDAASDRILNETDDSSSALAICNTINSSQRLTESICDRSETTHLGSTIEAVLERESIDAIEGSLSTDKIVDRVLELVDITRPSSENSSDDQSGDGKWDTPSDVGTVVLTLNSRYRPFDREILIELADSLSTGPVPFIMVSTQAIEAGVDLSFERVYRDIAPLDSVVQAAGRCNRSFEWGRNGGRVTIWTLAAPDDENPSIPSKDPPAHYVYETGSTDAGIPGHLRLISDVLAEVSNPHDVPDVELSRHAVDTYFEVLQQRKSLSNSDIREHIDDAKARWLARQSLIGGYDTVDVLVAVTDAEARELNRITELFVDGNPKAYERLEMASGIRVSVPADTVESSPDIIRIDGKNRGDDGVKVFRYTGESGLEYSYDEGGLRAGTDGITGRFTVI